MILGDNNIYNIKKQQSKTFYSLRNRRRIKNYFTKHFNSPLFAPDDITGMAPYVELEAILYVPELNV